MEPGRSFLGNRVSKKTNLPDDFYEKIEPRLYRRIGKELRLACRVVDLGCGGCKLARFLAERYDQQVTGVDTATSSFPNDEDLQEDVRNRLRCIEADARHLNFLADGAVDAVVMVWAVHEMEQPKAVLKEAKRVLRSGGELLIVDFPRDSLAQRVWNENYYHPDEISNMLEDTGYENIAVRLIEHQQVIWAKGFRPGRQKVDL